MKLRERHVSFPIEGDLTHSPAGERYASVVDRLLALEGSSRQVLVTSPDVGDGKTVTAVNLAFAFHARRISVLLAELSFAQPSFANIFGPSPLMRGIEDVIEKKIPLQKAICVRNDNNLSVAMVNRPQRENDLLRSSAEFTRLLAEAHNGYDWTIFDAPSVFDVPNIDSLAKSIGIVIMVVRARKTSQEALDRALSHIGQPQPFILLNDD